MGGVLIIAACLGVIPGIVASNKGYSFVGWWIFGAALFVVALPMALILRPNEVGLTRSASQRGERKCPHCAEFIKSEASVCRFCGRDVSLRIET